MSLPTLTEYRQSTLRAFATCPRRTRFELEAGDVTTGWSEASADLGTVVHAVLAEIMQTLWRQAEESMATEEAMVIFWEVYNGLGDRAAGEGAGGRGVDGPRLLQVQVEAGADARDRGAVARGPGLPGWRDADREGQPDLVIADPPQGVVCCDYKSGHGPPEGSAAGAAGG
jgi:hypothetical protein